AAVAGEDVPRDAEERPHRHQVQDQLVVAVGHEHRDRQVDDGHDGEHRQVPPQVGAGALFHARSAERPNRPCGRSSTIIRNTTKIAAFCNCVGRIRAENCCTKPMVRPPQNAPRMLPIPPSTTPAYMMMTKSSPTNGVNDKYMAISPPAIAVIPLPSPKAIPYARSTSMP